MKENIKWLFKLPCNPAILLFLRVFLLTTTTKLIHFVLRFNKRGPLLFRFKQKQKKKKTPENYIPTIPIKKQSKIKKKQFI